MTTVASPPSPVHRIPLDALLRILVFLPLPELAAVAQTDRSLAAAVDADDVWHRLCELRKLHARPSCVGTWRDLLRCFGPAGHGHLTPLVTYNDDIGQWVAHPEASPLLDTLRSTFPVTCFLPVASSVAALRLALDLMGGLMDCVCDVSTDFLHQQPPGLYLWSRPGFGNKGAHVVLLALGVQLPGAHLHVPQSLLHIALRLCSCAVVCFPDSDRYAALECLDVLLPPLLSPAPAATSASSPNLVLASVADIAPERPIVEEVDPADLLMLLVAPTQLTELSTLALWVVNFFDTIKALRFSSAPGCDCAVEHCGAATQAAVVQTLAPLTKPFVPVWMADHFTALSVTGSVFSTIVGSEVDLLAMIGVAAESSDLRAELFGRRMLDPAIQSSLAAYHSALDFDLQNSAAPGAFRPPPTASSSATTDGTTPAMVKVPLDVDQLVRSHDHFSLTALRRFACECDRLGGVHPALLNPIALKAQLSNHFRRVWRSNLEVSRLYCAAVFDACFHTFAQRYVASESAADSPSSTGQAASEALRDNKALKRFYAVFRDIVEEYCMKALGPRKYETLLTKGTGLLAQVGAMFRAYPRGRLLSEDVAQACASLIQELQDLASRGIHRHDHVRAEQQRIAAQHSKHMGLTAEVARLRRLLARHEQEEDAAYRWCWERLVKMQHLGFSDPDGPGLGDWRDGRRLTAVGLAEELRVAEWALEELEMTLHISHGPLTSSAE